MPLTPASDDWRARWYARSFQSDYLQIYRHRNDQQAQAEAAFVSGVLDLKPRKRLLDLGCGNGRHARALAAGQIAVVGLDLSGDLLNAAGSQGGGPRYLRGDMRQLPFRRETFDATVMFFTSFGYFESEEENFRVLHEIHRCLKPGGKFFLDLPCREAVISSLVPRSEESLDGGFLVQERWISPAGPRVEKKITFTRKGEEQVWFESVRLYSLEEIAAALSAAGLNLKQVWGGFSGLPFGPEAPRMLVKSEK